MIQLIVNLLRTCAARPSVATASGTTPEQEGEAQLQEKHSLQPLHDHRGFAIALTANVAILLRALPLVDLQLTLHCLACVASLAAILAWSLMGRRSYMRWRTVVQTAVRLQSFLLPCHRRMWLIFINQPPTWRTGQGAVLLNAWTFAASLGGQSYAGVLALLSFSHAVPLWVHVPLQLVSTAAVMARQGDLCTSALLNNEMAQGFMRGLHGWINLLCIALPLPTWPHSPPDDAVMCRQVVTMLQATLGLMIPTLVLAQSEWHAVRRRHLAEQERNRHGTTAGPSRGSLQQPQAAAGAGGGAPGALPAPSTRSVQGFAAKVEAALLRAVQPMAEGCPCTPSRAWLVAAAMWVGVCTVIP